MKKLRIGIFGVGRGTGLGRDCLMLNCDVVALCDSRRETMDKARAVFPDAAVYESFDDFINHDMDAVILANYFHQHAPYAIRCFERGLHVLSECISNGTMAEGVELLRAFERSEGVVYMLAENYPQMLFTREIKRVCTGGTLGRILYAEGEYNHPTDPYDGSWTKRYKFFEGHWRHHVPASYYVTHSLGPIMWATGATPRRITAFNVFSPRPDDAPGATYAGDKAAVMMTQNDDGSVFRFTGCAAFGGHHNSYRVAGTKGTIENLRGMGEQVMLRYNAWEMPEGAEETQLYTPSWNDRDEELIIKSGHGGGDYLTVRSFVEAIREGRQPEHPFDIYSAVAMSSVAILAHRSALEGGKPYDIPDMRQESERTAWENDRITPFPNERGEKSIPTCSSVDYAPNELQLEGYYKQLENSTYQV